VAGHLQHAGRDEQAAQWWWRASVDVGDVPRPEIWTLVEW
jgi:hypothetical protein